MRFGPVPVTEAEGGVLAHSLAAGPARLRKGRRLSAADLATLAAAGVAAVTVARLDADDVDEDAAAAAVAAALTPDADAGGLSAGAPFAGRVNLFAGAAGIVRVDRGAVDALNGGDPAITLATLPDRTRVRAGQMVATVKIIPYAVAGPELARTVRRLATASAGALRLHPFRPGRAALILTATPGMKASLLAKGAEVVRARLAALGQTMVPPVTVAHETAAVAAAIAAAEADIVLILGASATSDAADTCPAALVAAGGRLIRFGMPVDPGNLLFLGEHDHRPVVGLPGCARSPALNGADWVLERLAAGLAVSSVDIGQMGVGGLLKEIASRPQPRVGRPRTSTPPRVAALVLAAGAARRMRGRDKLLEVVDGRPLLRAVAEAALTSRASSVVVVLPPDSPARTDALAGLAVDIVEAPDWAEGMAASIRAGLAAAEGSDAVVLLLADMPAIGRTEIDRLIAAFDPKKGREICRAVSADGTPGPPGAVRSSILRGAARPHGRRGRASGAPRRGRPRR